MDSKRPDNIVFNTNTLKYDAALKSYGTSVGAPVIKPIDTIAWKNRSITKANHKIKTRYRELKAAYDHMMEEFEINNLIYNSKFSFEPIIGQVYHLYTKKDGANFLSIIEPQHCNFKFIGSFFLNAELIWEKNE
tara:strand:- start:39 stop:440 length:402 start_codon:yes stop_codon:yes gene_type:complete